MGCSRIIQLECVDTLDVEAYSKKLIPNQVKLFNQSRQMFVYFYKDNQDLHWSEAHEPDELYLTGQNTNGYWDSHYRYHYKKQV